MTVKFSYMLKLLYLLTALMLFPLAVQGQNTIKLYSRDDANARYAIGVIKLALSKVNQKYSIEVTPGELTSARQNEYLANGTIDMSWQSTSNEAEGNAIPIRLPLYKGLMGYRVLLIHRDNASLFSQVRSFDDLKRFKFGQGRGWPDTMIMQNNGLDVVQTTKYEGLFHMTDGQRFDAFPRGIHEPWAEIASRPNLELGVDKHVMIVYKQPFYLFVFSQRKQLANDINTGFRAAIDDGSFDQFFYGSEMVRMVFENVEFDRMVSFELKNPELPAVTPVDDKSLWVSLDELKTRAK